jgi:hypothetical protein
MFTLDYNYKAEDAKKDVRMYESYILIASSYNWRAAFAVTYAMEFFSLSVAKVMVLDRMSDFASEDGAKIKLQIMAGHVATVVVVMGNAVGLFGNAAAAVYFKRSADTYVKSAEFLFANNTVAEEANNVIGAKEFERAMSVGAVQLFCEVAVLLLIDIAFGLVGFACFRRIRDAVRGVERAGAAYSHVQVSSLIFDQAAAQGRKLQRRILGTTSFVFVAFLLRSVFSIMNAVAQQLQDSSIKCGDSTSGFCSTCHNAYTNIAWWMYRTPEFQLSIILISSPVALLVALIGMSDKVIAQSEHHAARLRLDQML